MNIAIFPSQMNWQEEISKYNDYIRANILWLTGKDKCNISLRNLADIADIDFSNFIKFMNGPGTQGLRSNTIIKIALSLNVEPEEMYKKPPNSENTTS